jgi:hypothetical protein
MDRAHLPLLNELAKLYNPRVEERDMPDHQDEALRLGKLKQLSLLFEI